MQKKRIHTLITLMAFIACSFTIFCQNDELSAQQAQKESEGQALVTAEEEVAISWDLDGVYFHPTTRLAKVKTILHVSPLVWTKMFKQYHTHGSGSIMTWVHVCNKAGNKRGAEYLTNLIRTKKIYPTTANLIQRLHRKKYKLFIASNVSKDEIALHKEDKRTRDVFKCFTDGVMVDDAPGKTPIKKPDPRFFQELKRIMQQHCGENTKFIFIDDKIENIKAAEKEGFITIHCTDPLKLQEQLRALGVKI